MRRLALALTIALATAGFAASPAAAAGSTCGRDGVAVLCVTAQSTQDVLALNYQVTQTDGPGTYSLYYVDATTGSQSNAQAIGPLGYRSLASGTLYAPLNDCYTVHLDSTAGTSLAVGPVCQQ